MAEEKKVDQKNQKKDGSLAGAPVKKKVIRKKVLKKKKKPSVFSKLWDAFKEGLKTSKEVGQSFKEGDLKTRSFAVLYFFALSGLMFSLYLGGQLTYEMYMNKFGEKESENKQAENLSKFFKLQRESAFSKEATLELKSFRVELIDSSGKAPGYMNMNLADIKIALLCKEISTCRYMEKRKVKVRDQIFKVLVNIPKEEMMNPDGKKKIREKIKTILNSWLPKGEIKDVYITKFVLG